MVNFCAFIGCSSRGGRDKKSFYRLPAVRQSEGEKTRELSTKRRAKWLSQISRNIRPSNLQYTRVCSDHFINGKPADLYEETNPDWAPTLKLGYKSKETATLAGERYQRAVERKATRQKVEAASALLDLQLPPADYTVHDDVTTERETGTASQTDLEGSSITAMKADYQNLLSENQKLKEKLNSERKFDADFFVDNDERVKYYTGLPDFGTLDVVYQHIADHIPYSSSSSLTKFQQLILCLMKLRLNLAYMDLADRFDVSRSTASRIFLNLVDVLHARLMGLIYWPDREQLRETMPMSFRAHFGTKVAVIMDCYEVFIERPSNMAARLSTWSSYKHNNTIKYLIGITPQGTISYISKGWGGRTSDKHLTENCTILSKLNPGDVVLADRGFDVADSVAMMGARLSIPAFMRGKSQLSSVEVEETRRLANVRIHVERVIGSLRQKYQILCSTLSLEFLHKDSITKCTVLDKINVICCALVNLCPSVVPLD